MRRFPLGAGALLVAFAVAWSARAADEPKIDPKALDPRKLQVRL